MNARQALAFIRKHGVVLEAAHGPVPSLAEVIAGEAVHGTWVVSSEKSGDLRGDASDPRQRRCPRMSPDHGKITFVHRRLWPALVRAAGQFPSDHLSQVREVHTSSGRHMIKEVPFPDWVPSNVQLQPGEICQSHI